MSQSPIPENREPPTADATDDLRDLAAALGAGIAAARNRIAAARQALDAVPAGPGDPARPSGAATSRAATELAAAEQAIVRLDDIARATIEAHSKTKADEDAHIDALWDRVIEAAEAGEDPLGEIDPRFAGEPYPRIAMAGAAIDAFVVPFGIAGETLENLYKLITDWEVAYVVDETLGSAGVLVETIGADMAEIYADALSDAIRRRRQSKIPAIFLDDDTRH